MQALIHCINFWNLPFGWINMLKNNQFLNIYYIVEHFAMIPVTYRRLSEMQKDNETLLISNWKAHAYIILHWFSSLNISLLIWWCFAQVQKKNTQEVKYWCANVQMTSPWLMMNRFKLNMNRNSHAIFSVQHTFLPQQG